MRNKGTFNFSGNLEVKKDAPLDARALVPAYEDLKKQETWADEDGSLWIYNYMFVACEDRPGKLYQLIDKDNYNTDNAWKEIGGGSGGTGGGIEEAPQDGKVYGRKNASWTEVISEGFTTDIPTSVMNLEDGTSSEEIISAFGGIEAMGKIAQDLVADKLPVFKSTEGGIVMVLYVSYYAALYTDANNFNIMLGYEDPSSRKYNMNAYVVENGVASVSGSIYQTTIPYIFKPTLDSNSNKITQQDYNDLRSAIQENRTIMVPYGLSMFTINDEVVPASAWNEVDSINIIYLLQQAADRPLQVSISIKSDLTVNVTNNPLATESTVLTRNNTQEYTPTNNYNPATKKYVDDNRYGKTFVVSNVNSFLTNRKETGSAAETATNNIFGSKESFRAVVDDIISNHTRYYIHIDGDANNCIELGCVNAWKNADSSTYQLHFVMAYYTGSTLYTKRISINSDNSVDGAFIEIVDLVNSDNINVMTKKTTSEYNSLSKNDNTAYFVVD